MISFHIILLLSLRVAVMIAGAKTETAEPSFGISKNGGTNEDSKILSSVTIGAYRYFTLDTAKSHSQAHMECQNFDSSAELAIITGKANFNALRLSTVPAADGTYWINGKSSTTYENKDLLTDCEDSKAAWNLTGISVSAPTTQVQCLAYVKADNVAGTLLKSEPCLTVHPVLCSMPTSNECANPSQITTTTTTTPAP